MSLTHYTREQVEELLRPRTFRMSDGEEIRVGANLHGAVLDGLDLSSLDFTRANLHGVSCRGTKFANAKLHDVNFHGAVLKDAIFIGADLEGANFHGACLCGAEFGNARLRRVNLCEACCEGSSLGERIGMKSKKCSPEELNDFARHGRRFTYSNGVATWFDDVHGSNVRFLSATHYTDEDRQKLAKVAGERAKEEAKVHENIAVRVQQEDDERRKKAVAEALAHNEKLLERALKNGGDPAKVEIIRRRIAALKEQ